MTAYNEFDQPIGDPVSWAPREPVAAVTLVGRTCRIEPIARHHLDQLYDALVLRSPASLWTYLAVGPFADKADFFGAVRMLADDRTLVPHVLCRPDGRPVGMASYLRVDARNGSAEIGWIALGAELQRTTAATESMYLMMRHVFEDLGYRRYEWKCDSLNGPSRRAAERLGFSYEGIFRQALVYKGRNRDTAWFSVTDAEWPAVKARFEEWLDPGNFTTDGQQVSGLAARVSAP